MNGELIELPSPHPEDWVVCVDPSSGDLTDEQAVIIARAGVIVSSFTNSHLRSLGLSQPVPPPVSRPEIRAYDGGHHEC